MSFVTVSRSRNKNFVQSVLAQDAAEIAAQEAEIQRRVRQEIAKLRETVTEEAKAAAEAFAQAEMMPKLIELNQALAAIAQAQAQLEAPLAQKEEDLAGLVLEMAFLLAKVIAGGESGLAREELGRLVASLLQEAAMERGPQQSIRLRLNPADAAALEGKMPEGPELVADAAITPGGAIVELLNEGADHLERTEWDATIEERLALIRGALSLPGNKPA